MERLPPFDLEGMLSSHTGTFVTYFVRHKFAELLAIMSTVLSPDATNQ